MNWRERAVRGRLDAGRRVTDDGPSAGRANRGRPRLRSVTRRAYGGLLGGLTWLTWRLVRRHHAGEVLNGRQDHHSRYWDGLAERHGDIQFVAIGDSTAQGIGARTPAGSYVGQLERMLGTRLAVLNLSVSGARLSDVRTALLPRLGAIDTDDALVTFAAGANDIRDFEPERFRTDLAFILDALPPHALVAEIPSFYLPPQQARVRQANAILSTLAEERDLTVVPLYRVTNRRSLASVLTHHAADLVHPNERGYRVWAQAFRGPATARLETIARQRANRDASSTRR